MAEWQLVAYCRHEVVCMIERRDSLFGSRVRVVQPAILLDQLRIHVSTDDRQAGGQTLLEPQVQTVEVGTAEIEVLLDDSRTAAARSDRIFRICGQQLRDGCGRAVQTGAWEQTRERIGHGRRERGDDRLIASAHSAEEL